MNFSAGKVTLLTLLVVASLLGCRKQKQPQTVAPQAQAPTVTAPQQPASTTEKEATPSEPAPSSSAASEPATTTVPPATAPKTKSKQKARVAKNHTKHPPTPATNAAGVQASAAKPSASQPTNTTASVAPPTNGATSQGSKVVVQQGGDSPAGQISAAGNDSDARSRQSIEQLLQSTDSNLRSISRELNADERAMVEQIRNYMVQARTASTDGDLTRANVLALKAHLLSDELVKR